MFPSPWKQVAAEQAAHTPREGRSCAAVTALVAREVAGGPGRGHRSVSGGGGRAIGDVIASERLRRRRAGRGFWQSPHDY